MSEEVNPRLALDTSRIARDVAMDIVGIDKILELHGLSKIEWETLKTSEDFNRTLASMIKEWNAASNTKERVAVKSGHLVEASLEWIMENLGDPDIPFIQKIEALKFVARLASLGESGREGHAGEKVVIQIVTNTTDPGSHVTIESRVAATPLIEGKAEEL
jgi:hypothetical protein